MPNTNELSKLTGFANLQGTKQQWRQLGTTAATVTVNFYALEPVGGNAVLSVLKEGTADALAFIDNATKTFYQDKYYSGAYTQIRVTSGEVIIRLAGN